jgi:ribonuclease-3
MLEPETREFLHQLTGHEPANEALWREALTHGSTGVAQHYQRLEFLGDRVLGLVIAEWLHEIAKDDEGKLSQRLNALVSGEMCAGIARAIGLGPHILLGKQARDDGGHDSDNILGDVMESVIGAGFVEHGYDDARRMVRALWSDAVAGKTGTVKHPKSALQEWSAGNRRRMPEYRLIERAGPDHAARFTVAVMVHGVGEAQATAASKQEAEKLAAAEFMRKFG